MLNRWDDIEAAHCNNDKLSVRVYSSRLLGREPDLVLFGGGNTSVKTSCTDIFGDGVDVIQVKGSGWDLATIEPNGFAAVRLDVAVRLAERPVLSDHDMVRTLRAAMIDPEAPAPSVETILHAIIPFDFVDHTHADAVVTIANTPLGKEKIRDIYGDRVLIVPYVMPGFVLAQTVFAMTREIDWKAIDAIILMNHGVFTFSDDARTAYSRMIETVTAAENYLAQNNVDAHRAAAAVAHPLHAPLTELAALRKHVSDLAAQPMLACLDTTSDAALRVRSRTTYDAMLRGPLTPDHVIRTKRTPLVVDGPAEACVGAYAESYRRYFAAYTDGQLRQLDSAPRWAIWPGTGKIAFGRSRKDVDIIHSIANHTIRAVDRAETLGGWQPLPACDIFEVEYWELEQAKLQRAGKPPPLRGRTALVTGAASGIGRACVERLTALGAVVAALDIRNDTATVFDNGDVLGIVCNVTTPADVEKAVATLVRTCGGLDIVISNAGSFPPAADIECIDAETWATSVELNLSSHLRLLQICIRYLKHGIDPAVVIVASKNVPAPGPGAAAYSIPKAGLSQLARVAALELAPHGIRVNTIHPNAVFDTALWTDDLIAQRAARYGMSVEAYRSNNLLGTEVHSLHVADMACAMAGPAFARTTGAQVPVDGGNDRVI